MNHDIHPIQGDILRLLLYRPSARFSELNGGSVSSDHFTFHIKRLVEIGLVEKADEHSYCLSAVGKEYANRFDTDSATVAYEKQAKICVCLGCVRQTTRGTEYLIHQRLKQPYFGYHGLFTGKIKIGEDVLTAAARELEEEAGLAGDMELVAVKHKTDYSPAGDLLEDKYFFVVKVTNLQGELKEDFEGGHNFWATEEEIRALPNLFIDALDLFEVLGLKNLRFIEKKYNVTGF